MRGNVQDIRCSRCNQYLFTEIEDENGAYHRENDRNDYTYDEIRAEFLCNDCFHNEEEMRIMMKQSC